MFKSEALGIVLIIIAIILIFGNLMDEFRFPIGGLGGKDVNILMGVFIAVAGLWQADLIPEYKPN